MRGADDVNYLDFGFFHEFLIVLNRVVAKANGSQFAFFFELFESLVSLESRDQGVAGDIKVLPERAFQVLASGSDRDQCNPSADLRESCQPAEQSVDARGAKTNAILVCGSHPRPRKWCWSNI